jgi:hypothetical protein
VRKLMFKMKAPLNRVSMRMLASGIKAIARAK